ncbi:hypothetical protein Tco_0785181 [Tanacetum coccineum]
MILDIHNWSSSAHQELLKIVKDEIYPIINQVNARVQNFEIQFLKEAAKFVRDFKSLANEANESLAKNKAFEFEIERLLRAVVSQDIMSIVQNPNIVDTSNLQTKFDPYKDMQNQIKWLQAWLGDLKGKSSNTQCASNTLDPLSQKLDDENVSLEFQVLNYAKENSHLKTTYKNLFDSIKVTQAWTKLITDSLQEKLHDTIYENATLRAQLFDKVSEQKDTTKGTSVNTKFSKQSILGKPPSSSKSKLYSVTSFSKPITSHSVPKTQESKVVNNAKVIAPRMFRINPTMNFRVDNFVPNKHVKESVRTKPIIVSQPHVITKKDVNSNTNGLPSTGVESTAKTRRPQPRSNPKNDWMLFASKSSCHSNNLEKVEEHHRNLLFSKTPNHKSSAGMNSSKKNQCANVSKIANQKKHKPNVKKSKKLGSKERLASLKPSKPRSCIRRLPTGRIFYLSGKITASSNTESESNTSVCDDASAFNPPEPTSKGFPNSTSFLDKFTRLQR